jgi:hypothetical protein
VPLGLHSLNRSVEHLANRALKRFGLGLATACIQGRTARDNDNDGQQEQFPTHNKKIL